MEALRVLAAGIYPPRPADAGLAVSLEVWQQRAGIAVDVRVSGDEAVLHGHEELEACLYFSLVTALGTMSAGSERPAAVVEIGATDIGWQVTGTAGSTGHERGLQAVRDRVDAFGGTMWVDDAAGDRVTARATVPLLDSAATTLTPDPGDAASQLRAAGSAWRAGAADATAGIGAGGTGGVGPVSG